MHRYVQNTEVAAREIDGQAVLIEPAEGAVFVLNRVGSRIWSFIEEPRRTDEITARVVADFEVNATRAGSDLEQFLDTMIERGLVARV